jgi:serine acetyltransferase
MRNLLTGTICLFFPKFIKPFLLNLLGHSVHSKAKIGWSLLLVPKLVIEKDAWIGNFNVIKLKHLFLAEKAFIKKFNRIMAPSMEILIDSNGSIGNRNRISRSDAPVSYGKATLKIGIWGQIVHGCLLDCTRSIYIGNYTTIGGSDTQFWTHGYYHGNEGIERIRIDGEIFIGNNVYVGTRCTFMPGVKVADAIHIGANCCISKSLVEPGMYVSQSLRFIENDIDKLRKKLDKVEGYDVCEEVYEKKI